MIDVTYSGKAKSSRQKGKLSFDGVMPSTTAEVKQLKTSRRLERSVDRMNNLALTITRQSDLATKHATARKQSGTEKASLAMYDKLKTLSLQSPPEIVIEPTLRSRSDLSSNDEDMIQASPQKQGETITHIQKTKAKAKVTQDETQLPSLPVRELQIQKAKTKHAISTLESPKQANSDLFAKRYGIKNRYHDSSTATPCIIKKINPAINFMDIYIQKDNNTKQQKNMRTQSYMVVKVPERKKANKTMNITPDLTAKLNKYDSEEQLLIKNTLNIKHEIRGPSSGLGYITKGSGPSKLENFQHAAKIYNKDIQTKRASHGKNRVQNALSSSKGFRSSMSQNSGGEVIKPQMGKQGLTVASPNFLLGTDCLMNADAEEQIYIQDEAPSSTTKFDSRAFVEILVLDHKLAQAQMNLHIQYPPSLNEALPSLQQQEKQLKTSAQSFYKTQKHPNQHPTGVVIPQQFIKQLVPPTYNSLVGGQPIKAPSGSNMFLKKPHQQDLSLNKRESRQTKQHSLKKLPINIYLNQPKTLKEALSPNSLNQSRKEFKTENRKEHGKTVSKRLVEQQKLFIQSVNPLKQANNSKNFKPVQTNSKKLKQKVFSRSNSSQGINSLQNNTITKKVAPYAERLEIVDVAMRIIDQVRLPSLPHGSSTFNNDKVSIGAHSKQDKQSLQACRQVNQDSDSSLDNQHGGQNQQRSLSKTSGDVFAQTVSHQTMNKFRSSNHSKNFFESHMSIQEPIMHQKRQQQRDSLQESRPGKHSMEKFESASDTVKKPLTGHLSRESSTKEIGASSLIHHNALKKIQYQMKHMTAEAPKDRNLQYNSVERSIERSCDELGVTQMMQTSTPFETPQGSQIALGIKQHSLPVHITNTETRKQNRNNVNPATTESLKSLFPNSQDQLAIKAMNRSEELVLMYDNQSVGEQLRSVEYPCGELQEETDIVDANDPSRTGLPCLMTDQDDRGHSQDSSKGGRKSIMQSVYKVNNKITKPRENYEQTYKNAIAIYSQQQLQPLKMLDKGQGRNYVADFLDSATGSKDSKEKESSYVNATSKLHKSHQTVQRVINTTSFKNNGAYNEEVQNQLFQELLFKAYQNKVIKQKLKESKLTPITKPEVIKLKPAKENSPELLDAVQTGKLAVSKDRQLKQTEVAGQIKVTKKGQGAKVVKVMPTQQQEQQPNEPRQKVDLSNKVLTETSPKASQIIIERPINDRSVDSKVTIARQFDEARKKISNNQLPSTSKKRSEQAADQEAKAKGMLLKIQDLQASLGSNELRDLTPPRQSQPHLKQARVTDKKSISRFQSHSQQILKQFSLEDFEWLSVLGRGSFGQVRLVRHTNSGEIFAMKQIQKERIQGDKHIQHVQNEKQILKELTEEISLSRHESSFFVNFIESLQDEENLYLLIEYLPGGELLQQIRQNLSLTMEQALFYLAEVLVAIQQLHQKNIIYRDLKPENILLDRQGHIKLIDFGFSKRLTDLRNDRVRTNCGTPAYAAPEVLIGTGYNYKADIWSFGILICEMLGGFTPFGPKAMEIGVAQDGFLLDDTPANGYSNMPAFQIIELVQTGRIILPKNLTPVTRDLVKKILVADPNVRLDIKDIMQHKFFEGIEWQMVARKLIDPPNIPDINILPPRSQSVDYNTMMPKKFKVGSQTSTKSNPYINHNQQIKRAVNSNKILGDFHLSKLNSIFENF